MGVDTDFGCGQQCLAQGVDSVDDIAHRHGSARVDEVNAGGSVALHEAGLCGQLSGAGQVAHHQEADGVHAGMPSRRVTSLT